VEAFKSIAAWVISPLILGLIVQSLAWCFWRTRGRKLAVILMGVGFGVLVIGSLPVLSFSINRHREYVYRPLDPATGLDPGQPVLVFVLGTGFNPDSWLPPNSRVSGTFLARLLEADRIYHSRPNVRMVVSVANKDAAPADKQAFLTAMIKLLSLDPEHVDLITEAESTDDEARLLAGHLREGEQLVLVTSASHMPRAITIFKDAGRNPAAAPTDFQYPRAGSLEDKVWKRWVPSSEGIGGSHQMIYESLASLWQGVKK
jgi:uncharacterized SAM-binding protein YcdF (DUF218 family)